LCAGDGFFTDRHEDEEVIYMNRLIEEVGKIVGLALGGWGPTIRLVVLAAVAFGAYWLLVHR
jgi:hypothetical protein